VGFGFGFWGLGLDFVFWGCLWFGFGIFVVVCFGFLGRVVLGFVCLLWLWLFGLCLGLLFGLNGGLGIWVVMVWVGFVVILVELDLEFCFGFVCFGFNFVWVGWVWLFGFWFGLIVVGCVCLFVLWSCLGVWVCGLLVCGVCDYVCGFRVVM